MFTILGCDVHGHTALAVYRVGAGRKPPPTRRAETRRGEHGYIFHITKALIMRDLVVAHRCPGQHYVFIAWAKPRVRSHQPLKDIGTRDALSGFGHGKKQRPSPSTPRPRADHSKLKRPDLEATSAPPAQSDVSTPQRTRDFDYHLSDEQRRIAVAVYFIDALGAPGKEEWVGVDGTIPCVSLMSRRDLVP